MRQKLQLTLLEGQPNLVGTVTICRNFWVYGLHELAAFETRAGVVWHASGSHGGLAQGDAPVRVGLCPHSELGNGSKSPVVTNWS